MYEQSVLHELELGNKRFVAGESEMPEILEHRRALAGGQQPKAVILGCADSRVPPEMIFDQGLGDLFVVRVAGNTAGAAQVASIEYAVTELEVPLIIVLGHSGCGAIKAVIDRLKNGGKPPSDDLDHLLNCIQPAVEPLMGNNAMDEHQLVSAAVSANVELTMALLTSRSSILSQRVVNGKLMIVGAEYSLESGIVEFR